MARPRLLFLASVAATLVSFAAAGGGESMGDGDCGEKETWKLQPGEEKRCCTSFLMNDVDRFEYKATPVVSGSWGPGSISFWVEEYSHFEDITNPAKVSAARCNLNGSARSCTGQACVSPGSSGKCKADVDISAKGHEDICVVAKCDVGAKCEDHEVEIKFHHNETDGEDWYDDDGDNDDWYGNGGEDFGDFESLMKCFAVCPIEGDSTFYEGDCGPLADRNKDRWCSVDGQDYCCAASSDDCCVDDDAAIAGITIAVILAVTGCCVGCCWFGKCCCFQYRRNTPAQVMYVYPPGQGPPGVQMTQMGYPQGTYPNQGYAPGQSQFGAPSYQYTSQAPIAAAPSDGNPYPTATIYTATIDPPAASAPVYPTAQAQPQIQYADGSRYTPPQGAGAGAMPKV